MSDAEDRPRVPAEPLPERFSVEDEQERVLLLQRLLDAHAPVTLHLPDGALGTAAARLLEVDAGAQRVALRVDDPGTLATALGNAPRVLGLATLDGVELRFELGPVRLAKEPGWPLILAALPRLLVRLQRRDAFRVTPPVTARPRLMVPVAGGLREAAIVDVSATGIAFEWPGPDEAPSPGDELAGSRLELPSTLPIVCGLSVRSSTRQAGEPTRLGAEFLGLDPAAERTVQVFVNLAQTRARRVRPRVD
jgi:c-di-GMP-binding flagellar brake protein YcgR